MFDIPQALLSIWMFFYWYLNSLLKSLFLRSLRLLNHLPCGLLWLLFRWWNRLLHLLEAISLNQWNRLDIAIAKDRIKKFLPRLLLILVIEALNHAHANFIQVWHWHFIGICGSCPAWASFTWSHCSILGAKEATSGCVEVCWDRAPIFLSRPAALLLSQVGLGEEEIHCDTTVLSEL
jgi:hypothetical protein